MDDPDFKELEQFIQQRLQKLPERHAPEGLIGDVFKSLAARQAKNWWQRPFNCWPMAWQCLLFASLGLCFAGVVYLASQLIGQASVATGEWTATLEHGFAFGLEVATALGTALWLALSSLTVYWFCAIIGGLLALYFGCIASGVAVYKIAFEKGLRAA